MEHIRKLYQQADYENTIKELLQLLQNQPEQVEANYLLGLSYFKLQDFQNASQAFLKAGELDQGDYTIQNNLGLIAFKQKKFSEAEKYFLKAIQIKKSYEDGWYNLGKVYQSREKWVNAAFCYSQCLENKSTHKGAQKELEELRTPDISHNILKKYKKILVVMEEGIGNMVMLTPMLKALKSNLPDISISVFGREPSIQVVQDWDIVDEIYTSVPNNKFDLICLTVWSGQFIQNHQDWLKKHADEYIKLDLKQNQHEADSCFQLIKYLGFELERPDPYCVEKSVSLQLKKNKKWVALSDTTLNNGAWERKRWPYYKELSKKLIDAGYGVVLIGGKDEAKQFRSEEWHEDVVSYMGKYNVPETASFLRSCEMFIGNDSGPAHIAAAIGLKTYVFFGATLISKNLPLGENVTPIRLDLPCSPCQYLPSWQFCQHWLCMKELSVDKVLSIVLEKYNDNPSAIKKEPDLVPLQLVRKDYHDIQLIKENGIQYLVQNQIKEQLRIHLVGAGRANYPWGMENEIIRALELEGAEVIETDYRLDIPKFKEQFLRPAHLMIVCKGSGIHPEIVRAYPGKTILWYQDDVFTTEHGPRDLKFNGSAFDLVYTFDKTAIPAYQKLGMQNVRWLPLAMSPALHRKMYAEKKYDVGFVGNIHPNRKPFFERLSKKFNLHIARAFMDDMVKIFNESKIVINLGIGGTGIQQRVFEALGCGSMLLTNEIPEDSRLFEDRKHLVYFNDTNVEELIQYYLDHKEEREKIAKNGYVFVHKYHSFNNRIDQVIKEVFKSEKNRNNNRVTFYPIGINDATVTHHNYGELFKSHQVDKQRLGKIIDERVPHISSYTNLPVNKVMEIMKNSGDRMKTKWDNTNEQGVKRFYEELDEYIYNLAYSSASGSPWRLEYLIRIVGPHIKQECHLLDFGAGLGEVGIYFSNKCLVTSLDVNGKTQQFAKYHAEKLNSSIQFVNQINRKESFDVVSAQDVLEHIENPMVVVKQIYDSLKSGGKFITSGFWFNPNGRWHLDENIKYRNTFIEDFRKMGLILLAIYQGDNWCVGIFEKKNNKLTHNSSDNAQDDQIKVVDKIQYDFDSNANIISHGARNAVLVTQINRNEIWNLCKKSVKLYCDKFNLDLIEVIQPIYNIKGMQNYNYLTFEKNQIYHFFNQYDRIIRLDSDILITPNCPNLFEVVPENMIGAVFEDVGSRKNHRKSQIQLVKNELGSVDWDENYFNSGMIVVSKMHKDLFLLTSDDLKQISNSNLGDMKEQTFLNWRIHKHGINLFPLDYHYNHMSMFSETWNNSADPLKSYLIHYAGPQKGKFERIKNDLLYFKFN